MLTLEEAVVTKKEANHRRAHHRSETGGVGTNIVRRVKRG